MVDKSLRDRMAEQDERREQLKKYWNFRLQTVTDLREEEIECTNSHHADFAPPFNMEVSIHLAWIPKIIVDKIKKDLKAKDVARNPIISVSRVPCDQAVVTGWEFKFYDIDHPNI